MKKEKIFIDRAFQERESCNYWDSLERIEYIRRHLPSLKEDKRLLEIKEEIKDMMEEDKNDTEGRIKLAKSLLKRWWHGKILEPHAMRNDFYIFPYKFIEDNNTLFSLMSWVDDSYNAGIQDAAFDIFPYEGQNLLRYTEINIFYYPLEFEESSEEEVLGKISESVKNVIEYRKNKMNQPKKKFKFKQLDNSGNVISSHIIEA